MRGNREKHARLRAVAQLFRSFVAALSAQFATPPAEVLRRAEEAVQTEPSHEETSRRRDA
jgi:hypothetical protein